MLRLLQIGNDWLIGIARGGGGVLRTLWETLKTTQDMPVQVKNRLTPHDSLSATQTYLGLSYVVKDGMASQAMIALTSGILLVDFAMRLGATNLVIGLLAAIPSFAQLMQVGAVYMVERYKNRHSMVFFSSFLSRIFLLFLVFAPFLPTRNARLVFLIGGLILHAVSNSITSCGWHSWMHDLVPTSKRGSFFSRRMGISMGLGMIITLVAGYFMDYWRYTFPQAELFGYSLLFALGTVAGLFSVYFILMTPEPRISSNIEHRPFKRVVSQPFREVNFRNLILFMSSWNFAVNLAAPFFTVYMLKRLELSLTYVLLLSVVSQLMNVLFIRLWGKFSDRFSNKSVLRVSGPIFIFCILAWTFTTLPEKYFLTVPLLVLIHIFTGISTAGVTISSLNIGMKLAPKGEATAYLATNNLINAVAAGIAPIIGGQFVDSFRQRALSWTITWAGPEGEVAIQTLHFSHWDFFFFLAFLVGLYSLHRLTLVKEEGEVKEKLVMQEFMSEVKKGMRNLSSVGGLRSMVEGAYPIFRSPRKYSKKRSERKT